MVDLSGMQRAVSRMVESSIYAVTQNQKAKRGIVAGGNVIIGNKAIRGCIACNSCAAKGKCVFDDAVNEAVQGLISLGYTAQEAARAVKSVADQSAEPAQLIMLALRGMSSGR